MVTFFLGLNADKACAQDIFQRFKSQKPNKNALAPGLKKR